MDEGLLAALEQWPAHINLLDAASDACIERTA